jgi:transcriptional regulator with XRE-family HTH domain
LPPEGGHPKKASASNSHCTHTRQGVTKSALARRLNTTRSNITQLLGGGRNLTLGKLAEMADALGCKVELHLAARRQAAVLGEAKHVLAPTKDRAGTTAKR